MKFFLIFLFILNFNFGLSAKYSKIEDLNLSIYDLVAKHNKNINNVINFKASDEFSEIFKNLLKTKEFSNVSKLFLFKYKKT